MLDRCGTRFRQKRNKNTKSYYVPIVSSLLHKLVSPALTRISQDMSRSDRRFKKL